MSSKIFCPPQLRGDFYTTPLYQRCMDFRCCPRCRQCYSYNRHNAQCVACESIKVGFKGCRCTMDQQAALVQLEQKLDRPFFDFNIDPQDVSVDLMQTSFNSENAALAKAADRSLRELEDDTRIRVQEDRF